MYRRIPVSFYPRPRAARGVEPARKNIATPAEQWPVNEDTERESANVERLDASLGAGTWTEAGREPTTSELPQADAAAAPPKCSAEVPPEADPEEAQQPELRNELDRVLRQATQLEKDFQNYRRHAEEQLATARREAQLELLSELGDAVRNLELADEAAEQDPAAIKEGVRMVGKGLAMLFDRHGLRRISTVGQSFDPELHEAVLVEEARAPRGTVTRELSPGFQTEDRVVRPAKVAVAA